MKTLCLDYLDSLFVSQNEKLGWSKKADYRRKNILSKFFKNELNVEYKYKMNVKALSISQRRTVQITTRQ